MLNLKVTKQDVENRANKKKMSTKQALSMQATIQSAMMSRSPQNPGGQVNNVTTANGFGRTV